LQQQPQQQLVQPLRQQEQQQQQQQQQQAVQPPVVEFGPYYSRTPVRQYHGHTEDILDLGWSSSGSFVLSASLDKTVRLWHLSQPDCLRTFEHSDFVTSVQFHPTDAQRFVSGKCDCMEQWTGRLWVQRRLQQFWLGITQP
jgi:WD40 repeat protein